ncbi:TPA: hypothetical protein R6B24_000111 [Campylobacter coli]|nr:hypothetical protein [Campylobacter coli]HED7930049.1 hypothetical protein [Campylobacter coli]HED7941760.1 hypothetical protein [Campylobacter coli]
MKLKDFDFRIWSELEKGYIEYPALAKLNSVLPAKVHYVNELIPCIKFDERDDEKELELWTGHFDKNDERIYEGDVVFLDDIQKNGFVIKREDNEYRVEFNKNYTLGLEILNKGNLLIVGNIHENPELLKC